MGLCKICGMKKKISVRKKNLFSKYNLFFEKELVWCPKNNFLPKKELVVWKRICCSKNNFLSSKVNICVNSQYKYVTLRQGEGWVIDFVTRRYKFLRVGGVKWVLRNTIKSLYWNFKKVWTKLSENKWTLRNRQGWRGGGSSHLLCYKVLHRVGGGLISAVFSIT